MKPYFMQHVLFSQAVSNMVVSCPGRSPKRLFLSVLCGKLTGYGEAQQQDVHEPSGRPGRPTRYSRKLTKLFGEAPDRLKSTGFTHRYRPWSWRRGRVTHGHSSNLPGDWVQKLPNAPSNYVDLRD